MNKTVWLKLREENWLKLKFLSVVVAPEYFCTVADRELHIVGFGFIMRSFKDQ